MIASVNSDLLRRMFPFAVSHVILRVIGTDA
jgi:hypothetical protein